MENMLLTHICEKCNIRVGALPGAVVTCPKGHKMKPETKDK